MILYVRSERAAHSNRKRRKLTSICEIWEGLGFEVELVCGGDVYGERAATPSKRNRPWTPVPYTTGWRAAPLHSAAEFRDIRHDKLLKAYLLKTVEANRPELIWNRASRLHVSPLDVAEQLGVPYVLEWVDSLVSYDISLFRSRSVRSNHRRMQAAFRVVVVSEAWKREIVEEFDIDPDKVVVSYNAVDPDQFTRDPAAGRRIREQMKIPANALVVGFVGSYAWFHQTHLVAEAAAELSRRGAGPVYWLMVGDGPYRPRLDALSKELGVDEWVVRQGTVPEDEVPDWLSAMDAAVVMSIGGDIIVPVKVPEYMASQLAPVVSDTPANREVVDEGRTGLLFRPDDPSAMADAVEKLIASPGLAAEMGRAAREEVENRFSWKQTWGRALTDIVADARSASATSNR